MKRQKIFLQVRQSLRESVKGSSHRRDEIDRVQNMFGLSSSQLRAACLHGIGINYWDPITVDVDLQDGILMGDLVVGTT